MSQCLVGKNQILGSLLSLKDKGSEGRSRLEKYIFWKICLLKGYTQVFRKLKIAGIFH